MRLREPQSSLSPPSPAQPLRSSRRVSCSARRSTSASSRATVGTSRVPSLLHLRRAVAPSSARRSRRILGEPSLVHLRRAVAVLVGPEKSSHPRRAAFDFFLLLRCLICDRSIFPLFFCTIYGLPLVAICSPVPLEHDKPQTLWRLRG